MEKPILIINLKTYPEGTGKAALKLLRAAEAVTQGNVILAVQAVDLRLLAKKAKMPLYAQHVDAVDEGNKTGYLTPLAAKDAGASGTLINHSEHRIPEEQIKKTIELCRKYSLATIVCAESPEEAEKLSKLYPDYIAIEPPELIGGDISVSKAKPEIITNTVNKVTVNVLCGAGVKTKEDARKAIELGSKGLLVASGIVKAKNPKKAIKELLDGMK
ncbi:MAG: triose-phosphate isomerase [Candidatus Nanoarchaeia archaeon]